MVMTAIKQKSDLDSQRSDKDKPHEGLQEMLPCSFFLVHSSEDGGRVLPAFFPSS